MKVSLDCADIAELAELLRFLDEWLASDLEHLGGSLTRLMDGHPYGVETLRHDLSRFRSLLGDDDRDHNFLAPPLTDAAAAE